MRGLILALAILVLPACNPIANLDAGEAQIARFQQTYSGGDADALYAQTGEQFQDVTSREQFQDLFTVIKARLGPVQSSERQGFNIQSNTGGDFTVVNMRTTFAQGEGFETFTFAGNGEDMELVGWHVNSDRLMLTPEDLSRLAAETPAVQVEAVR